MVQLTRIGLRPGIGGGQGAAPASIPATVFDDFTDTGGGTWPWYGDTHRSCIHFADTNVTWYSWETSFGNVRYVFVRTHDEGLDVWSNVYFAGLVTLTDDDHGVPSIRRDANGYVYIFYGCHSSAIQIAVTTSPNDPSAWTARTAVSGYWTYPWCDLVGNDLYLFGRGDTSLSDSDQYYSYLKATAPSGGSPSWSAQTQVIDFGASTRVYNGNHIVSGTDIYIPFTFADDANTYRQDVFIGIYDTDDGSFRNLSGSVVVAAGSLPISLATAKASFRIVDQETAGLHGSIPQICFDTGGDLHCTYLEGDPAGPFFFKHIMWDGASLSSSVVVGDCPTNSTQHQYDRQTCVGLSDGTVDLYWVTASEYQYTWGGNISRRNRSASGSLGPVTLVRAAGSTYPLNAVTGVEQGSAVARVVFSETVKESDWPTGESGILKCYALGDDGYSHPPVPAYAQVWSPFDFGNSVIGWVDLQDPGHLNLTSGQPMGWKDRWTGRIFSQSTAAAKPTFSATGWDGALPSLTGDGAATNGDILTASGPFAAVQTIFIVTERGSTQNTDATTSIRPILSTAIASGSGAAFVDVLRPSTDPGQTIVRATGQGTGSAASTAPDGFAASTKAVLVVKIADNDLRCAVDGGLDGSAGDVGATTSTTVGIFGFSGTAAQKYAGKIVEILFVNRVVTSQERQSAVTYFTAKWGL